MGRILDWLVSEGLGIEKVAAPKKADRRPQGSASAADWAAAGLRQPTARERAIALPEPGAIPRDPARARNRNADPVYFDDSEGPSQLGRTMRSPAIIDRRTKDRYAEETNQVGDYRRQQGNSEFFGQHANTSQEKADYKHQPIPKSPEAKYYRPDETISGKYESKGRLDDARNAQAAKAEAEGYPRAQGTINAAAKKQADKQAPPQKAAPPPQEATGTPVAGTKGAAPPNQFTVRRGAGYASLAKQLKMDMSNPEARQKSLGELRKMVGDQNKGNSMLQPGMQFNAPTLGAAAAYAGRTKLPGARPAPKPVAQPPVVAEERQPARPVAAAPVAAAPAPAPQSFLQQNLAANRPGGPLNTTGVISPVRKGASAGQQMNFPRPQVAPAVAPTSKPAATQMIPQVPMTPPAPPVVAGAVKPPAPVAPATPMGAPKAQAPKATPTTVTTPPKLQAPAVPKPKPAGSPL